MQILQETSTTSPLRIKPENADDLWELSHILQVNDTVEAFTERKVSLGADRSKQVRKPMRLTGTIVQTELQGDILRIQITITNGPEEWVSNGDHHSLSIQAHTEIVLHNEIDSIRYDKLLQTTKKQPHNILLVTFDREEAWIAQLTRRGYDVLQTLKGDVSKKAPGGGSEDFYATLADAITELDERMKLTSIIVASPAFWNEYLVQALPEHIKKKTTSASCSSVGEAALKEVLSRDEVRGVLEADQTANEQSHIQEVLEAISKDLACYGIDECEQEVQLGRVNKLLLSSSYVQQAREEGFYDRLDTLLTQAKSMNAQTHILSYETKQLNALGGVAGLLRW
ncbi:MAG: hypothetical protein ACMXYD_04215 [Candidatus Woesearchaeota archaeon]